MSWAIEEVEFDLSHAEGKIQTLSRPLNVINVVLLIVQVSIASNKSRLLANFNLHSMTSIKTMSGIVSTGNTSGVVRHRFLCYT